MWRNLIFHFLICIIDLTFLSTIYVFVFLQLFMCIFSFVCSYSLFLFSLFRLHVSHLYFLKFLFIYFFLFILSLSLSLSFFHFFSVYVFVCLSFSLSLCICQLKRSNFLMFNQLPKDNKRLSSSINNEPNHSCKQVEYSGGGSRRF